MEYLLGKLVCGLKKGEKIKVYVWQKTLDEKWNGFRTEWDDKKFRTEFRFLFQSWNSWTKTATKSCIANQWKKIPKWSLAGTKPTYNEKRKKQKNFSFVCKHQPKIGIHEPGLGDDVWSELVKELCWSKAITLGRQSKVTQERCEPNMCLLILTLWSKW